MGGCSSILTAEGSRSAAIDVALQESAEQAVQRVRLLLLGAGESGKSTILKQMRILYGPGFSEQEREAARPTIYGNTVGGVKVLLERARASGATFDEVGPRLRSCNPRSRGGEGTGSGFTDVPLRVRAAHPKGGAAHCVHPAGVRH